MDKAKPVAYIKIPSSQNDMMEVAFNPNDVNYVSVLGRSFIATYRLIEITDPDLPKSNYFQQVVYYKNMPGSVQDHHYSCHAWLSVEKKTVLCTEEGQVIILDEECKYETTLITSPYYYNKK